MQRYLTRKILVRTALILLPLIFWLLGSVKESYRTDSPDNHYSAVIESSKGWRVPLLENKYDIYVVDKQNGEKVLATRHPVYCVFEQIAVDKIQWQGNQRFAIDWVIEYNGLHAQPFHIELNPLRVKAGPPCCGAT